MSDRVSNKPQSPSDTKKLKLEKGPSGPATGPGPKQAPIAPKKK